MTESYWMDSSLGQWLHKCPWAKFELTLGPGRKTCIYSHSCDAVIPTENTQMKKDDPIPNASWGLKKRSDETLDSFK